MNSDHSPYRPPSGHFKSSSMAGGPLGGPPPVWPWYIAYCIFMGLVYLAVFILGIFMVFMGIVGDQGSDEDRIMVLAMGAVYSILGVVLSVLYLSGPFLPRRKWAWIWGIINIAIGLTSVCCLPMSIPLIIFWLKPETKQWFNADG